MCLSLNLLREVRTPRSAASDSLDDREVFQCPADRLAFRASSSKSIARVEQQLLACASDFLEDCLTVD